MTAIFTANTFLLQECIPLDVKAQNSRTDETAYNYYVHFTLN